jgi:putative ABC transport system ATP-binding protein
MTPGADPTLFLDPASLLDPASVLGPGTRPNSAHRPEPVPSREPAPLVGSAPLIRLEGVSRRYGSVAPVQALRDVHLEVGLGEWVAVVGASGSGKTTLLNILGCLDTPTTGSYWLDGVDVRELDDGRRAGLRARHIGFVFQSFHLLAHRSLVENVMLAEAYSRRPRAGRRERAVAALAAVGLAERAASLPTLLSGGERQRVAIARALNNRPRLLLCDEATGNLDSVTTEAILDLLAGFHAAGLTIVMITHEVHVAARAQRQVRILDGRVQAER